MKKVRGYKIVKEEKERIEIEWDVWHANRGKEPVKTVMIKEEGQWEANVYDWLWGQWIYRKGYIKADNRNDLIQKLIKEEITI